MEFLVEMIRVNAFDPRIWIILICIPLLLVRMVYVSIKRKIVGEYLEYFTN